MMAKKSLKAGDTVRWSFSQGSVTGKIVKKQTSATKIKGHKVAASKSYPKYIVKSAKTGAKAAHRASALKRGKS